MANKKEKIQMAERDVYQVCEMRETMSINGAAYALGLEPREVSQVSAAVRVNVTTRELARLRGFVELDKASANMSDLFLRAVAEYVDAHGLTKKAPLRRSYDHRKQLSAGLDDVLKRG
jgi:hypothetical protein